MPGGMSAEALKASQCPVPGAVVIAPLTQSVQNYGSLGGSFTVVGAPVIGASGATFDGVDDALWIDSGWSDAFTAVAKFAAAAPVTGDEIILAAMQRPSGGYSGWGLNAGNASARFRLNNVGVAQTVSTLNRDTVTHTMCIKRSGVTNTLYIDGASVASSVVGNTGYGRLVLAALMEAGNPAYFGPGTLANTVLYHSALSAPDQAAVEAYVAAA
jgi:hypothetical protein